MNSPISSLLLQAAAAAAGAQAFPSGALYVVATPIGNLADLTLRAIHVLSLVDAVACEDTRHTAPLLRHLGLDKRLIALHEHNERDASQQVLARLAQGERVAYVSDAGTPAVSDPGAVLVAAAQAAGYATVAVPGASSAVTAMSVAGDVASTGFRFVGFLPTRGADRAAALKAMAADPSAQIVFEAPHRIASLAASLAVSLATSPTASQPDVPGGRRVTVCRELTKQFETVATLSSGELPGWFEADANRMRGEFVLVVHGRPIESIGDDAVAVHDPMLKTLLAELPLKQAVSIAAELTGAARNALYARALSIKNATDE